MCGLTGMIGLGITSGDLPVFAQLLHLTMLRGIDSTGVATIDTINDRVKIKKQLGNAANFIENDGKNGILSSAAPTVFIGHCRSATKGSVTQANAHPFDTGRYVGAHNGTLVDKEFRHPTMTDSEMMFRAMEKDGVEEVLDSLDDWNAYAVSIWDKREKELILARNSQRPLYIGIDMKWNVMYWASEQLFLEFVADRLNLNMECFYLMPREVYRIKVGDVKKGNTAPWHKVSTLSTPKVKTSILTSGTGESTSTPWWDDGYYPGQSSFAEFTEEESQKLVEAIGADDMAKKANNQNIIKPENSKTLTVPKIKKKEPESNSFREFLDEVTKATADEWGDVKTEHDKMTHSEVECCICTESINIDTAGRETKYGSDKFFICNACDEWVDEFNPETGEIKPKLDCGYSYKKEA